MNKNFFVMPLNQCPPPSPIPDLVSDNCRVNFDQLVRFFIAVPDDLEVFDEGAGSGILDEASWDTRLAAVDGSKIQGSQIIDGLTIPKSEFITKGGNTNETAFGDERVISNGQVLVTGMLSNVSIEVAESYRTLSQYQALKIYFVNRFNQPIAKFVSGTGAGDDVYEGVTIRNFAISSRGVTGLDDEDSYDIRFSLPSNWEENVRILTADFDLITK